MPDLRPESLTWAGLLAHWMDFARASVALPDDATGRRWKASIVPIITLQAVTFALADLDRLDAAERCYAIDKAEVIIDRQADDLAAAWPPEPVPDLVREIESDARAALAHAALPPDP